jgi:hypothetical protein
MRLAAPRRAYVKKRLEKDIMPNAGQMMQMIETAYHCVARERGDLISRTLSHTVPGAIAVALCALFGAWVLGDPHSKTPDSVKTPMAEPVWVLASYHSELFDPTFIRGSIQGPLAQNVSQASLESIPPEPTAAVAEQEDIPAVAEQEDIPLVPEPADPKISRSTPNIAESTPLPPPRPAGLGLPASQSPAPANSPLLAQQRRKAVVPMTTPDNRTFFEKLFGISQPPAPALAYAAPDGGLFGNAKAITSPRYDRWTAVYDVAAHTVYMPDGTKLEAHSGLGSRLDDPRHVNERMHGATPPNVYDLQPREQLFHGVPALRLIPVGNGELYGRTGLLAHTYMLGPHGDSNGCVSFRNYSAFLQAYRTGQIKRLAVVASIN